MEQVTNLEIKIGEKMKLWNEIPIMLVASSLSIIWALFDLIFNGGYIGLVCLICAWIVMLLMFLIFSGPLQKKTKKDPYFDMCEQKFFLSDLTND